jgi:hypothetical protein
MEMAINGSDGTVPGTEEEVAVIAEAAAAEVGMLQEATANSSPVVLTP